MLHAASQIQKARDASRYGLILDGRVEMDKVRASIEAKQAKIKEKENTKFLRDKGINVVLGNASFASENEVTVGETTYRGRKIVVATGSSPRRIKIKGDENLPVYTHE